MAIRVRRNIIEILLFLLVCSLFAGHVSAQEDDPDSEPESQETTEARSRLFITSTDTTSVPQVTLRAYGFNDEGRPLNFAEQALIVRHGGTPVEQVEIGGTVDVGTFTVFLIDVTPGVEAQIPAIQQTIEQFAGPSFMVEQVDSLAIYRVGSEDATQALEPTSFYNSVRNFFAAPLEPQDGPTALIDSLVNLLQSMENISPDAALVPSIVVFSDGTDAVSSQYQADDVAATAADLAIPVHTVWLENTELTVGQEAGRNYLAQVANDAYGLAGRMDQPDTVTAIFERITAFRAQQLIRYTAPSIGDGDAAVELSLANRPDVSAETSVTINANAPTVTLNVPPDDRTLQLPDLQEPVRLALSADVTWLDGTERTLQQARLLANGEFVQDVPPDDLERFQVELGNLTFGDNELQLSITDEQGLQAVSPTVILSVVEGERQIPEALQPAGGLLAILLPICAGALALLLFLAGGVWLYRSGRLPTLRRRRERDAASAAEVAVAPADASAESAAAAGPTQAFLDVLETETQMPSHIPLQSEEIRLGRSPSLSDVAFEQDITVSRLHATILWDGHNYRLYDDDSTSGTWINDQEVPDYGAQLFDGDEIFLGKVRLRFRQQ